MALSKLTYIQLHQLSITADGGNINDISDNPAFGSSLAAGEANNKEDHHDYD
jgi:hypothetical protein